MADLVVGILNTLISGARLKMLQFIAQTRVLVVQVVGRRQKSKQIRSRNGTGASFFRRALSGSIFQILVQMDYLFFQLDVFLPVVLHFASKRSILFLQVLN